MILEENSKTLERPPILCGKDKVPQRSRARKVPYQKGSVAERKSAPTVP